MKNVAGIKNDILRLRNYRRAYKDMPEKEFFKCDMATKQIRLELELELMEAEEDNEEE